MEKFYAGAHVDSAVFHHAGIACAGAIHGYGVGIDFGNLEKLSLMCAGLFGIVGGDGLNYGRLVVGVAAEAIAAAVELSNAL